MILSNATIVGVDILLSVRTVSRALRTVQDVLGVSVTIAIPTPTTISARAKLVTVVALIVVPDRLVSAVVLDISLQEYLAQRAWQIVGLAILEVYVRLVTRPFSGVEQVVMPVRSTAEPAVVLQYATLVFRDTTETVLECVDSAFKAVKAVLTESAVKNVMTETMVTTTGSARKSQFLSLELSEAS